MKRILLGAVFAGAMVVGAVTPAVANHPPGPPDQVEICHKGKVTLTLPHQAADKHIEKHGDTLGRCP